jgi:cytochrome b subunit of formate dehydrogenase
MDAMAVGGLVWLALIIFGFILAIAWIILPFALIGTKPLLRQLIAETQRTNALLQQQRLSQAP